MRFSRLRRRWVAGLVPVATAALVTGFLVAPTGATAEDATPTNGSESKINSELVSLFKDGARHDFWIKLGARADNSQARSIKDWDARGTAVAANLRATADQSQAPVRALLDQQDVRYQPFWISNTIFVTDGTLELAREVASLPGVTELIQPFEFVREEPFPGVEEPKVDAVEWGIADINADDVWSEYGFTGAGIVVANLDTGVQYDHPALVEKYRGNLGGGEFDNNYNWYDVTGASEFPQDGDAHGTHTMGTIVGSTETDLIGVAPGAKWIASNALMGSFDQILGAMQWMLEPLDLNGENPDASKRPNVISNSWGVDQVPTNPFGDDVQRAWIDSGIFATWSNRNLGPDCDSTGSPGGRVLSYSNGAYDINHQIASFSSRGPGQDGMLKPNISGPGVNVRSSVPGGQYLAMSGTSMSTPHLAGSVALVWSAAPALIGEIDATRELFDDTAVDVDATECGGTVDDNNVFGEGRLDALAAIEAAPIGDTGVVSGQVTDAATGDPIAGAEVHFTGASERHVTTDADGRYETRLVIGEYVVMVHAFGYVDGEESIQLDRDETINLDFPLEKAKEYSLYGRVRERGTNQRLAGITVTIAGTPFSTTTNENGGYRFEAVPAGTYEVTALGEGCHDPRTKTAEIDGIWPLEFKGDERKRFKLESTTDQFGYTCRSGSGDYIEGTDAVDLTGDEEVASVDLPFAFPYYGESYESVQLSSNGHLRFVSDDGSAYNNVEIPNAALPNGVIAAFWDDLILDRKASVLSTTADDSFTIEYQNVNIYDGNERLDFSITLSAGGNIAIAYRGIDKSEPRESGSSATVGIENAEGTVGLMYAFETEGSLWDGMTLDFLAPTG